jgi:Flp pilus assembly CpaF family ATPase
MTDAEIRQLENMKNYLGVKICDALADEDITEIMINPNNQVFIESRNKGMFRLTTIETYNALNFVRKAAEITWKNTLVFCYFTQILFIPLFKESF